MLVVSGTFCRPIIRILLFQPIHLSLLLFWLGLICCVCNAVPSLQWRHDNASQIACNWNVYSKVCSGWQQRKQKSFTSLAFCHIPFTKLINGPLWGESTGHRWIPLTKGQLYERVSMSWRHHMFAVGACDNDPCRNGGLCIEIVENGTYACNCTPGWSGQNCEEG